MSQPVEMRIDIVSDIVCPWCYIGFTQLSRALAQRTDEVDAGIRWHPFELAPSTPPEGQSMTDYVRERYGASAEQSASNRTRITQAGAAIGLDLRFSSESRIYNSNKAHQLLCWAGEQGRQTALKLTLFKAYFTDGANISDDIILLDAVESIGLDRVDAAAILDEGRYVDMVAEEVAFWQDRNVTGVPAFIFNGQFMVPGAQDVDTFLRVIDKVREKMAA